MIYVQGQNHVTSIWMRNEGFLIYLIKFQCLIVMLNRWKITSPVWKI